VIASAYLAEGKFTAQRVGERNLRAVAETAGALPLMFAASPQITDIGALLALLTVSCSPARAPTCIRAASGTKSTPGASLMTKRVTRLRST
jgi:hypothetical protein